LTLHKFFFMIMTMGIRYLFSFVCFSIISLTTFVSISQTVPIYTGFVALINYFISVFRSGRFDPGEIVFAAVGNLFDLLHLDGKKITLAVWVFFSGAYWRPHLVMATRLIISQQWCLCMSNTPAEFFACACCGEQYLSSLFYVCLPSTKLAVASHTSHTDHSQ